MYNCIYNIYRTYDFLYPLWMDEICAQTKHLSAEHTHSNTWGGSRCSSSSKCSCKTNRQNYNSLTTFIFCKLCGTVSGNLFISLFFDDIDFFPVFAFIFIAHLCVILNKILTSCCIVSPRLRFLWQYSTLCEIPHQSQSHSYYTACAHTQTHTHAVGGVRRKITEPNPIWIVRSM